MSNYNNNGNGGNGSVTIASRSNTTFQQQQQQHGQQASSSTLLATTEEEYGSDGGDTKARPLPNPPSDGITRLKYMNIQNNNSILVSSSWDGNINIYDTVSMTHLCCQHMNSGPLLDLAVSTISSPSSESSSSTSTIGNNKIYTAGVDGSVKEFDIPTSTITTIGYHSSNDIPSTGEGRLACSCLSPISIHGNTDNNNSTDTNNMIVSAGWDRMFHLWDVRQSGSSSSSSSLSSSITKTNSNNNNNNNGAACSIQLPGKAFSMDVDPTSHHNRVVIATSGRKICIIDLRMMTSIDDDIDMDDTSNNNLNNNNNIMKNYEYKANMILERQSSLKYQSRVVRYLSSPTLAIGSIEGRVAIEFLHDEPKLQPSTPSTTTTLLEPYIGAKRYAFKCHRLGNLVHTVNAIVRHPIHGTFATGGSDGTVSVWDGMRKKRLSTLIGVTTANTTNTNTANNDTITKFETGISDLAFKNDGTEIAIAASYAFEEGERDHPKDEIYIRKVLDSEVRPKALSK